MGNAESAAGGAEESQPYTPEYGKGLDRKEIGEVLGEFEAHYIGSVSVKEATGNDVCADAIMRIKGLDSPLKAVKMIISAQGIYTVERHTESVVAATRIPEISFVCLDAMDKKVFSFICMSNELLLCHGFSVAKRAQEIPVVINQAFRSFSQGGSKVSKSEAMAEAKAQKSAQMEMEKSRALGAFAAKYLGSVPVREARGNSVVMDAVRRIKALEQIPRNVEIIIYAESIDVVEAATHDLIRTVSIMEVSFTAFDRDDKRHFSYITNDSRLGLIYCHAFSVKSKAEAAEIPLVINRAFQAATALMEKENASLMKLVGKGEAEPPAEQMVHSVFEAKYIGFVPVTELRGEAVVHTAYASVKNQKTALDAVVLVVSSEGVRAIEGLTGEVIRNVFIKNISFTCVTGARKEVFGFISHDERLGRVSCHLYDCGPRAFNVCVAIGDAFKVVVAQAEAQKGNPFAPTSAERESVSGDLFMRQVHRSHLVPIKPLGAGQFGEVHLAKMAVKEGQVQVAVKLLRGGATMHDKSEFLRESEIMARLEHGNLVRMVGVAVQQRPWLCVIEFMLYGDLRDVLETCKEKGIVLTPVEQLTYAIQIAAGMAYMAENRFIHMDLAARNVLLHIGNVCKVADFGLTRPLDEGKDHYLLTKSAKLPIKWIAIEALDEKIFSEGSDVWAYGVLLWEILSYGEMPFITMRNQDVQRRVREGLRLAQPEGSNDLLYRAAASCWHADRYQRPRFAALRDGLTETLRTIVAQHPPPRDIGAEVKSKK